MRLNKSGFTLIELLVVVLIIGILAAIALPQYQIAVERSKAAEAFSFGKTIVAEQELYYLINGSYTRDWNALNISCPGNVVLFSCYTPSFVYTLNDKGVKISNNHGQNYSFDFYGQQSDIGAGNMRCVASPPDDYLASKVCKILSGGKDGNNGYYIINR